VQNERQSSSLDFVPANSKHKVGQSDTDLNEGSNVHDRYPVRLSGRDRYDVRTCVPRPREKSPILSGRIDPVSFNDRMPLFLKPDVQSIDVETHLAELEWERQDAGGLSTEMRGARRSRHSSFPSLVLRTVAAMAVAALIAGMLVFKPDLKELGLLTSELKNGVARIMTTVYEPTNHIAGVFAAIPIVAPTKQESTSDPERSGRAVAQLTRHASTLLPKGVVNSYAMVSPGKTDSQEPAVDVRDSPRVIDQVKLTTLVTPPDTAAQPVPTAPPRRLDADELAALIKRAKSLIAVSDIAPARLLLERAAEAQEPSAAFLLAETYEPAAGTQDIRGITPDPAMARSWYEKAVRFGSTEAQQRLAKMRN
jgi:hypothetical protein